MQDKFLEFGNFQVLARAIIIFDFAQGIRQFIIQTLDCLGEFCHHHLPLIGWLHSHAGLQVIAKEAGERTGEFGQLQLRTWSMVAEVDLLAILGKLQFGILPRPLGLRSLGSFAEIR